MCPTGNSCKLNYDALHVDVIYSSEMIITVDEIEVAISQLEKNKSCGIDAIICRTYTVLQ